MDFSKLRPFLADSDEDGPETVLVLRGFADRHEVQMFMDALMAEKIVRPRDSLTH